MNGGKANRLKSSGEKPDRKSGKLDGKEGKRKSPGEKLERKREMPDGR
jgi:hypothetical protein